MSFAVLFIVMLFSCGEKKIASQNETLAADGASQEMTNKTLPSILFFGNSITAGYQLDMEEAFPHLIQLRLDSMGYSYQVINAGLSGETTAAGKERIDWVLRSVPDIFCLELGANDGLRGLPLDETEKNLQIIIDKVKQANPQVKVILAGMQVPPNMGAEYTDTFKQIFPRLAQQNQAELIPFILDGVAGNPELNLSDGIHPTAAGHQILAETVWKHLLPLLEKQES